MNQIQNFVLVDNEWVSRPLDVYQLMAQARDSDTEMPEATIRPPVEVPELGLLSRTLLASPLFKAIRPANIRHKDFNDIVLIGEDAVQLKEIHRYGHLRQIATKSDFKGRILAARVFGEARAVPVSVGSPLGRTQTFRRERRSITGDEGSTLPPEVVLLTLTSRTLMFLWAQHTPTGTVSFRQRTVRLPAGISQFDRFGAFLAVDPKCRAMAVAALEGRFILYKTKSMQVWRKDFSNEQESTPIEEERIIHIEGRIMHMEFLSSADAFHVVLLFIVVLHGKTRITCFDWDCREDLSKATARTERVLVDFEDQNPALLIPLNRTPDFLLVFDTHISAYKDVLSGAPRRVPVSIHPPSLPSLLPGDSKHRPHWVAWDKAPRNPDFPKETFYVAREDGRVIYVEQGPAGSVETEEAGDWQNRIDTAFACLSVDNSELSQLYPDVLIAGGAGNDGLLCKVGSWPAESPYASSYLGTNQFATVESIPSWAPLMDLSVARLSGTRSSHERDRSSLFVANGASPHGEVSELRYGLQSYVDASFGNMAGTTGLWLLDHGTRRVEIDGKMVKQHAVIFTVTMPPETLLIRLIRTQRESGGEFSGAWEDGAWKVEQLPTPDDIAENGVVRDVETIAACPWNDNFAVQVTRREVRLLRRPNLDHSDSIEYNSPLLLSAIRPGFPFFATVLREANQTFLEAVRISHEGRLLRDAHENARMKLDYDPTCIELFEYEGVQFMFLSTFDSKIFLLAMNNEGHLTPLDKQLESPTIDGASVLLESAVLLSGRDSPLLVCATRSGYLLSYNLHCDWKALQMGTTSAKIMASSTDTSTAFVSCGTDFCRVRCSSNDPSMIEVDSIWFTDNSNLGYEQAPVTAAYQLPSSTDLDANGRNLGGFLFAVAGDAFLFSRLESDIGWNDSTSMSRDDCRTVPRKILTRSKPTTITYIKALRKLLVAKMEARQERPPPHGCRVLDSTLALLNVHDDVASEDQEMKQEEGVLIPRSVRVQHMLKHAERVYSITEWPFTDHRNKKYTLIIVGTGFPTSAGKEKGRRLIFNPGKSGSKLDIIKESQFDDPVFCTAIFGNETTVSAIGRTLTFDVFNSEAGLLSKRATVELPSPGIHINVRAPFVYVSTLQHSHLCFEVVDGPSEGKYEFKRVFTDSRERRCASHLLCDVTVPHEEGLAQAAVVLVTDKTASSLTGLYHPPERTYKNAAETVFEACLPHTVVRIQQGNIRPPWRRTKCSANTRGNGVLVDDIIGSCSDGTIYTFSILGEPARHLLRFFQNLIEEKEKRDPANQYTSIHARNNAIFDVLQNGAEGNQDDKIRAMDVDPRERERGQAGPRHKHIDGDLVGRWLRESGDVEALLKEGTEDNVLRLYADFAKALWGDEVTSHDQAVAKTKEWLGEVFMPLF
ncbi:mono-functional DNA-alkylating methyl methanesulfonate N-term-domain-containing protein [Paraphoma chrysanthemicola]|uniref:Mono-functional DNA-alkylating methyl methanesulfonate N-term-domain-containing protein n=1 Tax=Paraphoma chrysanthemicola TaxID=798071 RepID=A0A8K0R224_9PLEO|nr:mono-functional DNA-alkylating methyl methanesulfonate N-term-domain-containing protein [Paraphoma chrysanthemicola]